VVDTGADPGIPHQAFGRWEAGDVADGREHRHGGQQAEARELDQIGPLLFPGGCGAQAMPFGSKFGLLLLDVIQGGQVL